MSLASLPWKAQLAAFVALALASVGAFYYFYEMDVQTRLTGYEAELNTINSRISKGMATARQLPEFRKEVADLQARLESLKPILPEEKDAADLLRHVNTLAVQSNLTIRGFRPQPISTKQMHAEWPIALELEGSYHNLGLFLDRVSKFPRIINIGALAIKTRPEPEPHASIQVTCTATTFVLIEGAAGAAGKGAAPATKTE
jgi:type IV pilus assembly protein PilO